MPNVEAEIPGVEENALESRMRSCAPCALPDVAICGWTSPCGEGSPVTFELRILDLATGRVHATCAGVRDGFVCDLCWHAFERSGAHPLVISCGGVVVQLLGLPEDAACVCIPARLHARIRLPSHVFSVWRWEGEVRCQRDDETSCVWYQVAFSLSLTPAAQWRRALVTTPVTS